MWIIKGNAIATKEEFSPPLVEEKHATTFNDNVHYI
jgi:hypothetical protein